MKEILMKLVLVRSEGGTECQRTPEANGSMPDFFGTGLMPMQTDGDPRSYSAGSYYEPVSP
jgi:hypothetical protein